jgi:hypothetical protein
MRTLIGLSVALLSCVPASAAPFTWVLTGNITNVVNGGTPFDGLLTVGDPFTLVLNMESTAPDVDPNLHCGQYAPITSMQFTSGGVSQSVGSVPAQNFLVKSSAYTPADSCLGLFPPMANAGRVQASFGVGLGFVFDFTRLSPTDALPISPIGISPFTLDLNYALLQPVGNARISAITAVPEPVTSVMILMGLAGIARRWRR